MNSNFTIGEFYDYSIIFLVQLPQGMDAPCLRFCKNTHVSMFLLIKQQKFVTKTNRA